MGQGTRNKHRTRRGDSAITSVTYSPVPLPPFSTDTANSDRTIQQCMHKAVPLQQNTSVCHSCKTLFCFCLLIQTLITPPFLKTPKPLPPQNPKQTNNTKKPHNKTKQKINTQRKQKTELFICPCLKSKFDDVLKF